MNTTPVIDGERLKQDILAMGGIGGSPAGVTRRAFTPEDAVARAMTVDLMREAGLDARVDAVGNVFGRRPGEDNSLPVLMVGSHIDSVPDGGMFDGCLGVLGGIAVVRALNEAGVSTRGPLEVVAFSNEEGAWGAGTFGSRAFVGLLTDEELNAITPGGQTIAERMESVGLRPKAWRECVNPYPVKVYLELHIEQGGVLEAEGLDIGVVTGIVGTSRWSVTVRGVANHAGTTPMRMRDDALVKTARFILAVDEEARRADDMVATMGRVSVYPDAANVIPGLVRMTLGMRSMKQERVDLALARLQEVARSLSAVDMETIISKLPVLMDESLVNEIEQACAGMGLRYKRMPSGAGHDAMCIARVAPVGMIFVPSRDGKSHVREEFTAWQYAVLGAQVLLNTIASLA